MQKQHQKLNVLKSQNISYKDSQLSYQKIRTLIFIPFFNRRIVKKFNTSSQKRNIFYRHGLIQKKQKDTSEGLIKTWSDVRNCILYRSQNATVLLWSSLRGGSSRVDTNSVTLLFAVCKIDVQKLLASPCLSIISIFQGVRAQPFRTIIIIQWH